ncbi:hypothetical protein BDZ89DRAFT_1059266 [Hymenopellis radicata]|nr:hypothetical protein BDZ89DRAFT_1059266 [Hymenopellis radicata]
MSSSNFQAQWTCKYRRRESRLSGCYFLVVRTVAFLLDASSEWLIPTFPFLALLPQEMQFGLDSVIGAALPAVGDAFCLYLSLYQVLLSKLFGLPWYVVGLMLFYIVTDAFIGVIPLVGDFFDVAFKANIYNLRLLEKELKRSRWDAAVIIPQSTDWIPRPRKTNA